MRGAFSSHSLVCKEECVCYRMAAEAEPLVVSSAARHKTDDSTGLAKQVAADLRIVRCRQASPDGTGGASWGEVDATMVGANNTNDDGLAVQGETGVCFGSRKGGRR